MVGQDILAQFIANRQNAQSDVFISKVQRIFDNIPHTSWLVPFLDNLKIAM
jgi:hypothetical protein